MDLDHRSGQNADKGVQNSKNCVDVTYGWSHKLELREEATEGDALDVVDIMRASMVDTAADPSMAGANGSLVRNAQSHSCTFLISLARVHTESHTANNKIPQNFYITPY